MTFASEHVPLFSVHTPPWAAGTGLSPSCQAIPHTREAGRQPKRSLTLSHALLLHCRAKGFAAIGSQKASTIAALAYGKSIESIHITTRKTCGADACSLLIGVECLPTLSSAKCTPDANNNIGDGNVGKNNYGPKNNGNGNIGAVAPAQTRHLSRLCLLECMQAHEPNVHYPNQRNTAPVQVS